MPTPQNIITETATGEKHLWKIQSGRKYSTAGYDRVLLTFHSQRAAAVKHGYVRIRNVPVISSDVRFENCSDTE